MNALASWLLTFFQNFFAAFVVREAAVFLRRLTVLSSLFALISALTAAFFAAIQSLFNSVLYTLHDALLAQLIPMFWPVHFNVCLSVLFSAHLLRWVYDRSLGFATIAMSWWR